MVGAGFIKFHQLIGDEGGGGQSSFYSVKLCVLINVSLCHNVLCFSFVVVLYSMHGLYAVIKVFLLNEGSCCV